MTELKNEGNGIRSLNNYNFQRLSDFFENKTLLCISMVKSYNVTKRNSEKNTSNSKGEVVYYRDVSVNKKFKGEKKKRGQITFHFNLIIYCLKT